MRTHPVVWALRACWLVLPFTVGDALGRALDGRSAAVTVVAAGLAWAGWVAVLVASLVPRPGALTTLRLLAPAGALAAIALVFVAAPGGESAGSTASAMVGIVAAIAAAACALTAVTADAYVDGASYGDERRFALRAPVAFLLGPIPVFWLALVGGLTVGPLLLAARQWVVGAIVTAIGLAVARPALTAFAGLASRWLVFVPAGVTLKDHLALIDPVLFPTRQIAGFGPAVAGTDATDLTQNAPGLVLEAVFTTPVEIVARLARAEGEVRLVQAILLCPGRPGAVMAEAQRRGVRTAAALT
jgi:hypothetical protein